MRCAWGWNGRTKPRPLFTVQAQQDKKSTRKTSFSNRKQRPNFRTFFGETGQSHQISLYDQFANDGGGIRFSSPYVAQKISVEKHQSLPIMIFLPGFDGVGVSIFRQTSFLLEAFEFMICTIPIEDRSSFDDLLQEIEGFIQEYVKLNGNGRPVYLVGESFGALLALMIAFKCPDLIDRLVLINPATSYEQSIWPIFGPLIPQIPNELYLGVSIMVAPFLGNPLSMMAHNIDLSKPISQQTFGVVNAILEMLGTLGFIEDVFTPDNVAWKLGLVQRGVKLTNPILSKIKQRTLLITCDGDWMLPSRTERERLMNLMPRCLSRSMGFRSHALLLEVGVNLVQILKEEGFYVTQRKFSVPGNHYKINGFGTSTPIELPTDIERKKAAELFNVVTRAVSPVFYSTTESNEVVHGLKGIPDHGPLLFVGNHQLIAQDTFTLVDHLMHEKKFLLRGLAHPLVTSTEEDERPENLMFMPMSRARIQHLFATFGAVQVSPKNLYSLLKHGERILLYPGGAREAFKLKDEKYQLFWPETAEFVRMAGRFNATIITVAAVGLEDWLRIVLDREEILQTPILRDIAQSQIDSSPEARPGQSNATGDIFLTPLVVPEIPKRHYFLFGKPFQTTMEHYKDKEKCQALYQQIKEQLENNIMYLQRKSNEDPYGDFAKRIIYENSNPGKQAPSFKP